MLKKLLEEFAEKEAHTREEINVITQQIDELEHRIVASQQRLQSVSQDSIKVKTMLSRYTSREWLTPSATAAAKAAEAAAALTTAGNGGKRKKKEAPVEEPTADAEPLAKISSPSPRASSTRLKALPDPTLPQPQPESQPQSAAGSSSPFRSEPQSEPMQAEEPVRSNEPAFTFNNLFTSSTPAQDEAPPAPVPGAQAEEVLAQPALADVVLSSGNWSTLPPATTAPGPSVPSPATTAPGPSLTPAPPTPSAASALSASSFFSDDEDDDDMLSPQSTPAVEASNNNPFLKSAISGKREQTEASPQEAPAAEAAPFADPANAALQPPAATQDETPAQVSDLDDEEGDDTVKSINDALRGLFR